MNANADTKGRKKPAPDADAALQLQLVGAVLQFVRSLPSVDRLDAVGERVFGDASDPRVARLKESVAYFGDGSRDGYFRHKSLSGGWGVTADDVVAAFYVNLVVVILFAA